MLYYVLQCIYIYIYIRTILNVYMWPTCGMTIIDINKYRRHNENYIYIYICIHLFDLVLSQRRESHDPAARIIKRALSAPKSGLLWAGTRAAPAHRSVATETRRATLGKRKSDQRLGGLRKRDHTGGYAPSESQYTLRRERYSLVPFRRSLLDPMEHR